MRMDMHAHSSGISRCCRIPYGRVLEEALEQGIDGIVLTNHYAKDYIEDGALEDFVERYIAEFQAAQEYGEGIGCRVLFGIEVTMERYPAVHMLVYGVEPDFLRAHPTLFDCSQAELFSLVCADNGLLVQAHPFRNGTTVLGKAQLHGVEINCHPKYGTSCQTELISIARESGLLLTCGGDYHADTYRPACGMNIPDSVKTPEQLRAFLVSPGERTLYIHEPNTEKPTVFSYHYPFA